jgi:WhiB family redox-sensing transcriptional regulator
VSERWTDRAACAELPAEVFFIGKGDDAGPAKAICATCPVARACLEGALERDEEFGIWGGAGESVRRWLSKPFRDRGEDPRRWERAVRDHLGRLRGEAAGRSTVVNRNTDAATCGHGATYARGCRCRRCTLAAAMRTQRSGSSRRREAAG